MEIEILVAFMLLIIFTFFVIYPPPECVSGGVTVQTIFQRLLGVENDAFITYHIRKSCLNLFIYSILPLVYVMVLYYVGFVEKVTALFTSFNLFWDIFATTSLALPILSLYQVIKWLENDCENHPIAVNLKKNCDDNLTTWKIVADNINQECRRSHSLRFQSSVTIIIVVTDTWILKVTPFTIFVINLNGALLSVKEAYTCGISTDGDDDKQYLKIEAQCRERVNSFSFRVSSGNYHKLKERMPNQVLCESHILLKTETEEFIEAFKEIIKHNPTFEADGLELDMCLACSQQLPNVKIKKLCVDSGGEPHCSDCHCRPLWCSDCLAQWFQTQQRTRHRSTWMSGKSSCPMCRSQFCVLDVCMIR